MTNYTWIQNDRTLKYTLTNHEPNAIFPWLLDNIFTRYFFIKNTEIKLIDLRSSIITTQNWRKVFGSFRHCGTDKLQNAIVFLFLLFCVLVYLRVCGQYHRRHAFGRCDPVWENQDRLYRFSETDREMLFVHCNRHVVAYNLACFLFLQNMVKGTSQKYNRKSFENAGHKTNSARDLEQLGL